MDSAVARMSASIAVPATTETLPTAGLKPETVSRKAFAGGIDLNISIHERDAEDFLRPFFVSQEDDAW